ncbi:hypothetical protein Btru_039160 [Bulinus truncatus]|nr:hypothetical protein Btru_039160 [Bulinus truncatus]
MADITTPSDTKLLEKTAAIKNNVGQITINGNNHNSNSAHNEVIELEINGKLIEPTNETGQSGPLLKALDGGYGWVVVLGCFLNNMVLGGFGRSEGLFFMQYQERFHSGAQLTSWPSSLMSTLNLFMVMYPLQLCLNCSCASTAAVSQLQLCFHCSCALLQLSLHCSCATTAAVSPLQLCLNCSCASTEAAPPLQLCLNCSFASTAAVSPLQLCLNRSCASTAAVFYYSSVSTAAVSQLQL